MVTDEPGLIDSNVLVYAWWHEGPQNESARRLRDAAAVGDLPACICPQVLQEFASVITDSRRYDFPFNSERAAQQIRMYVACLPMIFPGPHSVELLADLVETHGIVRHHVHDAALAATMLANGVTRIYTANAQDFAMFEGIEVINPFEEPEEAD